MEFIHQIKQLEELEKMRKKASVQAINDDFIKINEKMRHENVEKF